MLFFTFWANNHTTKLLCILRANKYEREVSISSLQSTNALQYLQIKERWEDQDKNAEQFTSRKISSMIAFRMLLK